MKVEVQCSINSGMYNVGDVIDLPKGEAEVLIEAGMAKISAPAKKLSEPKETVKVVPHKRPKTSKNN